MNRFKNKVIWVVGASSGYGEAMARAFIAAGAKVILSAHRVEKLQLIKDQQPSSAIVALDLAQMESFVEKTQEAIAVFGHIDILVLNAGIAQKGSVLETQPAVARHIMNIDYFSYTELARCILPHFIERNSGQFVVVSGLLAKVTLPGRSSYAAAKAALPAYFGCLRAEVAKYNIQVTILTPGALQTNLVDKAIQADGSTVDTITTKPNGCPLDIVAEQSLKAIAQRKFESYIGKYDKGFILWKLSHWCPPIAISIILKQVR